MGDGRAKADAAGREGVQRGCDRAGVPVATEMVCPERIDRYEQNVRPFGRWTSVSPVVKDHQSAGSEKGSPKGDESPPAEKEASMRSLRHGRKSTEKREGTKTKERH
jgi:hypothetical protein